MMENGQPIDIRAHTLLCLQGFRGRGYSDEFVVAMGFVHRTLKDEPDTPVRVLSSPDVFCAVCPHSGGPSGGCTLGGPGHETHMRAQDQEVMRRLGLTERQVLPWSGILERIRTGVRGSDLPAICTTCPWLSLGWCAEGIDTLR